MMFDKLNTIVGIARPIQNVVSTQSKLILTKWQPGRDEGKCKLRPVFGKKKLTVAPQVSKDKKLIPLKISTVPSYILSTDSKTVLS